jgi:hypothetical protein
MTNGQNVTRTALVALIGGFPDLTRQLMENGQTLLVRILLPKLCEVPLGEGGSAANEFSFEEGSSVVGGDVSL